MSNKLGYLVVNILSRAGYKLQVLRPVIKAVVPRKWQYAFSSWCYSSVDGPLPVMRKLLGRGVLMEIAEVILHRLYWLTNPRGES